MSTVIPFGVRPMLATLVREPFHRPGWVYEEKYDGYRILAHKEGNHVKLFSRNSKDRTGVFPNIARLIAALPTRAVLLDGEVVAFDRKLVSRFQLLQNQKSEPSYAVFDCLFKDHHDLRGQPLSARRKILEVVIGKSARLFPSHRLAKNGLEAYKSARRRGYEGVIAKDESGRYVGSRSNLWVKFKVKQEDEFVVAGYTAPAGSREHLGALLLGAFENRKPHGKLRYVGKVGTGFTRESLARLIRKFRPLERSEPSLVDAPAEKGITHLAPRLVAQIAFQEWTNDSKLRQPVFLGLRDDKKAQEVVLP